jgi:leucyl-tRNA synthetase
VAETAWPIAEPALIVEDVISLPVQVNGKKRGDIEIDRTADQGRIEAAVLALDFVQKALEGRPVKKIIIVPQRIVNVVG